MYIYCKYICIYGKKPTILPFVPDNPHGRISELLLDTTVVHDKACARKKKKYDVICAQNGLKFPTNNF